jgi:[calcium/calmodulin-dependent protein kinase] kinase
MKAVGKFKRLLSKNRPPYFHGILGPSTFVQPPEEIGNALYRPQSETLADRVPVEGNLATRGILREIVVPDDVKVTGRDGDRDEVALSQSPTRYDASPTPTKLSIAAEGPAAISPRSETGKGQAHDPLEDTLFLSIGISSDAPAPEPGDAPMVSESPGAVEFNVYENAYEEEIRRILTEKSTGRKPTLYLTKRVEDVAHLRDHQDITNFDRIRERVPKMGLGAIAELARLKNDGTSGNES